jgi:hypothetical protein
MGVKKLDDVELMVDPFIDPYETKGERERRCKGDREKEGLEGGDRRAYQSSWESRRPVVVVRDPMIPRDAPSRPLTTVPPQLRPNSALPIRSLPDRARQDRRFADGRCTRVRGCGVRGRFRQIRVERRVDVVDGRGDGC